MMPNAAAYEERAGRLCAAVTAGWPVSSQRARVSDVCAIAQAAYPPFTQPNSMEIDIWDNNNLTKLEEYKKASWG